MTAWSRSFRSRYERLADQNIVRLAQTGDIRASEYMLYKYRGLVRTKIRSYFLAGAEKEDLLQIGMIGLWQSIMDYSPAKDISFLAFARICIERHVITAIKTAGRYKQSPLNNSISLDCFIDEADLEFNLEEVLISQVDLDPAQVLIKNEESRHIQSCLRHMLSSFEWEVLKLYNRGKSYKEIALDLACNMKSVDNALGRIKRKMTAVPGVLPD